MKKDKIVLAAVLKPVNDTRMFEKLALSLGQTNKYDINIIGFCTKKIKSLPGITFHPVFNFSRTSPKRLLASWKYYKMLLKVKPKLIIVTTVELLLVSCIYKILFGAKLCYDVQENYFRNIRYTSTYPWVLRVFLAYMVKGIERLSAPYIDHYFLAEQCYVHELDFPKEKTAIILNKFKPLQPVKPAKPLSKLPKIRFLYTGTIGQNYGIFEAIYFAKKISKTYPFVTLHIIGYAPDQNILKAVKESIQNSPYIHLTTGNRPIPHQEIISAMPDADFALLPYQPDLSIENRFPTKIWEYMAHGLPMIIQQHPLWLDYCQPYQSCIPIDYKTPNPESVLQQLLRENFYQNGIPDDIFWKSEELTLLNVTAALI